MIRCADYILSVLADDARTGNTVFLVSGGGAMHLVDAVGRNGNLQYVCTHHEQAAAMAAEGYARTTGKAAIAVVTSGPGGGNAVTGVMGAWLDSIPMVVLSGQVKTETTILRCPGVRQLGDQEINIVDIVRPITKYAVMLKSASEVKSALERAIWEATSGRPGPVWIDVPLDVQGAMIDPDLLPGFTPPENTGGDDPSLSAAEVAALLNKAKRPLIIAGNGVRLAHAAELFRRVVDKLGVPVQTAISGIDLIETDHQLFYGRPGILGERAANFIIQNCDLLLVLGTRMNLRIISYAYESFARGALKIMVDIDREELEKPTFVPDVKINADAGDFLAGLERLAGSVDQTRWRDWLAYCSALRDKYPVVLDEHRDPDSGYVSSYYFAEKLSEYLAPGDLALTGNGTAYTSTFQAFRVKSGQRLFANVACASMGYDLPAAAGAAFGFPGRTVTLVTGDGSIQMNIQELQTIKGMDLPIRIFVFNNQGYLSIKTTQRSFFEGFLVASDDSCGVTTPPLDKIAAAYGIPFYRIRNNRELDGGIKDIMTRRAPLICEVMTDPEEVLGPRLASVRKEDGSIISKPLEDLSPLLDREEFRANMIVEPLDEK